MKKNLPMISLTLGLLLSLIVYNFSALNPNMAQPLPSLGMLFMAELGMLFCAYGVYVIGRDFKTTGVRLLPIAMLTGNLLLALNFIYMGLALWQIVNS